MNHIYRSVWNNSTATCVATAETTKNSGNKVSSNTGPLHAGRWALKALAASLWLAYAASASALPQGGEVTAGSASVTVAPGKLTIVQGSPSAVLNWQSFSIGAGEAVQFVQPSANAVALNRVVGTDPSTILGSLSSNGKVFLVNPNGILFGKGASVSVGGLVASTLNLTDDDFMAGRYTFSGSSTQAVRNQGTLNAPGGYIALLGAHVSNDGVIAARMGSVSLAGGQAITLDVAGDGLLNIQIDQGAVNALVSNGGLIQADGGHVLMTAQAAGQLLKTVVNNTGVIQAQSLVNHNGSIKLLGDMQSGTVNAAGTLDASAPAGGDGGFIETSAAHVNINDTLKVTTAATAHGLTGNWLIDPTDYTIAASGGDQTGAFYTTALQTSNVSIATVATGAGLGDINVNDTIAWSANKLTLTAHNNIHINQPLRGSGTASLALEYGQGAVAAGNTATYNVKAAIDLPSGQNFSTRLGSDTALPTVYTVINSLGDPTSSSGVDLQGMSGDLAGKYVLGSNIDASASAGWNSGMGFTPVGTAGSPFAGVFDGLGHTVSHLKLRLAYGADSSSTVSGLFGSTATNARIRNVGLVNVGSYTSGWGNEGRVGALVGINRGAINNSYATGTVVGNTYLGGLVGLNQSTGTINNSYFSGSAVAGNRLGGLVGVNEGSIANTYSTGEVRSSAYQDLIGGLVGHNNGGTISTSYASAEVSNADPGSMGSLVGYNNGSVSSSHWNVDVGAPPGIAGGTTTGATGLTSTQMKQQANFVGWDFANTWLSQAGLVDPLLRAFMAPLTVKANDATMTYNGGPYDGAGGVTYSSPPNASLLGTVTYGSLSQNPLDVGIYTLTPGGLHSSQHGYIISYASGTLTVNAPSVNLGGNPALANTGSRLGMAIISGANMTRTQPAGVSDLSLTGHIEALSPSGNTVGLNLTVVGTGIKSPPGIDIPQPAKPITNAAGDKTATAASPTCPLNGCFANPTQ